MPTATRRRLLNAYESLVELAGAGAAQLDEAALERTLGELLRRYDKGGDQFYDSISALHKSVRGSDPDAALYWLARMLDGGADPRYLARRVLRMASEDIGLADPRALRWRWTPPRSTSAWARPRASWPRAGRGLPGGGAQVQRRLQAWNEVRAAVKPTAPARCPMHLRNAPTRLMKQLGHGQGYRYAHDEPGGFAAGERYLPDGLPERRFYQPVPRGLELRIGERLAELRR
jgi:putative ATPase